jgi:PAS domain S-box-containing protein
VALPVKFVVTTTGVSRNWLSLLFSLATVAVFIIGYLVARRIIQPLNQLVHSSLAVAQGDLTQRTGIERSDEIGYLAHSFDVMTERLSERTRQLLEQASKLEAILDSTADGIIVLNQQASIITINPKARHILADAPDDFVESILQETTMPQVAVDDPDSSRAVALSLTPQTKRYRVNNRIFGALASPVKTPAGEVLGTVIALRDITREVEAEQLKDTFITNISHDLRTPLTSIRGYSDLLLKSANDSLNATQRQFLETINRNTQTLMQHVDEIIDITELQAGQLKLEQETVCFSDLIKALITKWQDPVAEKGLSLHTDLPTTPLYVQGDANRLRWAVENLLDNAYQYNLDAGKIIIVLQVVDHKIQLDITDTGIGVAPEDQPYLFTQFFRADNEQMYHVAGVGLGLFITRTLIELHQGQVWATSQPDLGSTFSVSLPQLEPQTTAILDQEQTLA